MRLRHIGIKVENLERAVETYKLLGFNPVGPVETFRVQKLMDHKFQTFEICEGDYNPHVAVDWVRDEDGNLIELVEELKHHGH